MASSRRSSPEPLPPAVALVGTSAVLLDRARAELRARAFGGAPAEFDEDRFDFAEGAIDGARILDAARLAPVLAPRRLVWVRGLEDRRAREFLERLLPAYLEDPSPTTTLVLEAATLPARAAWVEALRARGAVEELAAPRRAADVAAAVEAMFAARGKRPGAGVVAALLERVGADLDALDREVEKLALYAGERESIELDDVAEVACELRPHAVFELTDALDARDARAALAVLARLLEEGQHPLAILAALATHARRLLRARACTPLDAETVRRQLGVHPFVAKKLAAQARRARPERLRARLERIARADAALKGASPLAPRAVLEQLVLALAT